MKFLFIDYNEPVFNGEEIIWKGSMTLPGGESHNIFFEFSYPNDAQFKPSIRPFLIAFLVPAMRLGLPIRTDKPIDLTTLNNLMEWQEAMELWRKPLLQKVSIKAPIESGSALNTPATGQSITAFSGGVDSCFTAFRHALPNDDLHRQSVLGAGLMVGGFDIPISQTEVFNSAWRRSESILKSIGVPLYRLRTNLRQMEKTFGCCWETETHGTWLAATLACYESCFSPVIIPSTYIYEKLKLPWASNPITDHLFSSDMVSFWHDGAAYNKLTKVQAIASQPSVQENLRVCWQGQELDRNCGKCFKCIATQVCFWLSGVENPACFPNPCTIDQIAQSSLRNDQNQYLFEQLSQVALSQGKTELNRALISAIKRHRNHLFRRRAKETVKYFLGSH
jgi:hypothetical protein